MKKIPVAGSNYTMLVDFNYGGGGNLYRMDMIHLNPFHELVAFDSQLCRINDENIKNIHVGDVGIYVPEKTIKHSDWIETVDATWKKQFEYLDHNFELATVLGFADNLELATVLGFTDKTGKIGIYGKKIGNRFINSAAFGIERGDDLLIQLDGSNNKTKCVFVHDISQELLKYNLQQKIAKKL